ncbi:MAG: YbaB/EbfC family nucleoid-associated protein [Chthoniobacterales bacterium]|nr:YbaB/EbfC family nucleoid-associated protein [Chthoniobacterales bacterium]
MNIAKLVKQAQQMQAKVAEAQEELARQTFEGSAGGGKVHATVNGAGEVVSLKISPEVVDPEDVDFLQDLILAAIREASGKAKDAMREKVGKLTGGLGLPF